MFLQLYEANKEILYKVHCCIWIIAYNINLYYSIYSFTYLYIFELKNFHMCYFMAHKVDPANS